MQQMIAKDDGTSKLEALWVDDWYIAEWEVAIVRFSAHVLCALTGLLDVKRRGCDYPPYTLGMSATVQSWLQPLCLPKEIWLLVPIGADNS